MINTPPSGFKNMMTRKRKAEETAGGSGGGSGRKSKPRPLSSKVGLKRKKMRILSSKAEPKETLKGVETDTRDNAHTATTNVKSQGDFTGAVHPLLINHIVDKVIGFAERNSVNEWHWKQQLLQLRLVNSTWHDSATRKLQAVESARWTFGFNCEKKVVELMEIMKDSTKIPFTKLNLEPKFFSAENKEHLENLFVGVVPYLTELSVGIGQDFSISFDIEKLNEGLDLSKLKVLAFRISERDFMTEKKKKEQTLLQLIHRQKQLLGFLKILIGAARNLERFEYSYPKGQLGVGSEDLEPLFTDEICKSLPRKVKHLELQLVVENRHLDDLAKLRLNNVQTLSIKFYGEGLSAERLQSLLASFGDSPVSLKLYDNRGGREVGRDMKYPIMNKLKLFQVEVSNDSSLVCLESFPNLRTLVIDNVNTRRSKWIWAPRSRPHRSLVELIMTDHVKRRSVFFSRMPYLFPNIRSLSLNITRNNVQSLFWIFKYLSCLEELRINFPVYYENLSVDSILTGIPSEICRELLFHRNFVLTDFDGSERLPNLTSLRNLTKLELTGARYSIVLTSVTAIFGFLQTPSQCQIVSDKFNIAEKYIKSMEATSRISFPRRV